MNFASSSPHIPDIFTACLASADIRLNDVRSIKELAGDGSSRHFYRLSLNNDSSIIAVGPAPGNKGLAEARSAYSIGRHLFNNGVPVPEILSFDEESGALICEDLGDQRLHDVQVEASSEKRLALYEQAIEILVHMQNEGGKNFNLSWCHETPFYDRTLMLERESGYFLHSLCRNFLEIDEIESGVQEEFFSLADRAAKENTDFFLHRDFQSRNLMITRGKIRVIDFQGGRAGPLAYDLASLLIDPYAALNSELRENLLQHYLVEQAKFIADFDMESFIKGYFHIALQRNLQILGAFAFLSQKKQKKFFRAFIRPALNSLNEHLALEPGADYPYLRNLATHCLQVYDQNNPV